MDYNKTYRGIVDYVDSDIVSITVIAGPNDNEVSLPIEKTSAYPDIKEGDFCKYTLFVEDDVLRHRIDYFEPPELSEQEIKEIDDRIDRLDFWSAQM